MATKPGGINSSSAPLTAPRLSNVVPTSTSNVSILQTNPLNRPAASMPTGSFLKPQTQISISANDQPGVIKSVSSRGVDDHRNSIRSRKAGIELTAQELLAIQQQNKRLSRIKAEIFRRLSVFIEHPKVETCIILTVVGYAILVLIQLAFQEEIHANKNLKDIINVIDLCILGVFSIEISIKTIVFGWAYMWDIYQLFDALMVVLSIAMGILEYVVVSSWVSQVLSLRGVLRVLRILIIFRRVSESQSSLSRIKKTFHGHDISSPIDQVMMTMTKLILCRHVNRSDRAQLNEAISIIRQGKLYEPVVDDTGEPRSSEAQAWLLKAVEHQENVADYEQENQQRTQQVNMRTYTPETERLLLTLKDWKCNMWEIDQVTSNKALAVALRRILFVSNLCGDLNMDCWDNFVTALANGYDAKQEFHNSVHAADVSQLTYWFITQTDITKYFEKDIKLTAIDRLSLFIGSAIHDVDHRGLSNNFLALTRSPIAIRYNDKRVMEMHHIAVAYRMLSQKDHNIFDMMNNASREELRALLISNVLATDIASHFEHLGKLKSRMTGEEFPESRDDKVLLLGILLHMGDISNPVRPRKIYVNWTQLLFYEYFRQGDEEKRLGFNPVSMFTDRTTTNIAKCQIGFIDILVHPLYSAGAHLMDKVESQIMPMLAKNKKYWEDRIDLMQSRMGEEPTYFPPQNDNDD